MEILEQIKQLSEIEFDQLMEGLAEYVNREGYEDIIERAFTFPDDALAGEIIDLENTISEFKDKIRDMQNSRDTAIDLLNKVIKELE